MRDAQVVLDAVRHLRHVVRHDPRHEELVPQLSSSLTHAHSGGSQGIDRAFLNIKAHACELSQLLRLQGQFSSFLRHERDFRSPVHETPGHVGENAPIVAVGTSPWTFPSTRHGEAPRLSAQGGIVTAPMSRVGLVVLISLSGCATAQLAGARPPLTPMEAGPSRLVVIEPLFERSELRPGKEELSAEAKTKEKGFFLKEQTRSVVHDAVVKLVARLRPHWRVFAPSAAPTLKGQAVVVRTVVDTSELAESDRTLKNAAFAFGLVILPLQILAAFPVEETQRIGGSLEVASLDAGELQRRLVKYATQPDYSVNLGLQKTESQPFLLDVTYEEGLFADETPRPGVLVDGFVEKLAFAIVTFVEEKAP